MYHYETLGDERFQAFCQALISADFPDAQCLPVGQPDGGRDAFQLRNVISQRNQRSSEKELIVFQVKFIKNPSQSRAERDMIEEIIKKEKPKVERLKAAGLSKYYLITNLQGTAHYESGSIDKVNKRLHEELGIEAYCWWRDDLDRRLDSHSSIKWSYPEVLKATDLLEKLVHGQLGEEEDRRKSAIRAYITSQYDDDQDLKFKQTDLRSTMTDLFVDLPMQETHRVLSDDVRTESNFHWTYARKARFLSPSDIYVHYHDDGLPSAEYFLSRRISRNKRIVLEGAPGQGKSTVTQYACQVLRMHLLNKTSDLRGVPEAFRQVPARIPFRVDLRDLAKWISGVDPFQPKDVALHSDQPRSLEGFLAGQVRSLSGGHNFDVSDLTAVAKHSHIFLALDGFDEVADTTYRKQLVDEITKGTNRLMSAGDSSILAVVTSRPAAFAKSVRFPQDHWSYFELMPLERRHIDAYTAKWTRAKGLKNTEQIQLQKILDAKLREAHTQYLAKNPMQLTILLSLVYNRGPSLPEKRTAMYDTYMDMFFSRESEKSEIVRDNRELLIDIHRYLAWRLQTSAEAGENGSIEQTALRVMLFEYLDKEGEDTSIVDALFNGIIERVGALVSRVQETYEFEVQPLREYFSARHLYETAPYPTDDHACTGDKFDRFKALVSNPYWLNVARFYGGCFNKGELLTLANEITELGKVPPYASTSHPRSVAMMLLSDWVFSAYQPAVKQVVSFIGEHPEIRQLLANAEETGASHWSSLPERSGRSEFLEILWQRALKTRYADERQALARAIIQNSTAGERATRWTAVRSEIENKDWIQLGANLKLFEVTDVDELERMVGTLSDEMVGRLVLSRRFDSLMSDKHRERAQKTILHSPRSSVMFVDTTVDNPLSALAAICSVYQYGAALSEESAPLRHVLERRIRPSKFYADRGWLANISSAISTKEQEAFAAYNAFLDVDTGTLSTNVAPWKELIDRMRAAWGDCPAIDRIAIIGAGVKSKKEFGSHEPLTQSSDLLGSVRFARLKSGAPRWWDEKLKLASTPEEIQRLFLILMKWATVKTLLKIIPTIEVTLQSFSLDQWLALNREIYMIDFTIKNESRNCSAEEMSLLLNATGRVRTMIGNRLSPFDRYAVAQSMAPLVGKLSAAEMQFVLSSLMMFGHSSFKWKSALPNIKKLYKAGASVPVNHGRVKEIPAKIASQICEDPDSYPLSLVASADTALRSSAGEKAAKLLEVAGREKWFSAG